MSKPRGPFDNFGNSIKLAIDKIRLWLISSSPLASSSRPYHQTTARYKKCYFAQGWSTFLMQPTSGGPSGPSVAQNYCIFTAKVGLGCQKPQVFTTFDRPPRGPPQRPSRGRQDKRLPRDPPGPPRDPPGPPGSPKMKDSRQITGSI